MSMKMSHLIRTNHIVFSHPVLSVIAFIWICVSMKIADQYVIETSIVIQFVLNLIGFILIGLLLYIIPCLCSRKQCKNTNSIMVNISRKSSSGSSSGSRMLSKSINSSFGLYSSIPKQTPSPSPVEGIKINQQPITYYVTPEQQSQHHIYITPISTPNATITPTENDDKDNGNTELPKYKNRNKKLINSVESDKSKNSKNSNDNDVEEEEEEDIILPDSTPVKSDYIISQINNNRNNIPPLPDINTLQYNNNNNNNNSNEEEDEVNPLNNPSLRPLSTIIEVSEENTPHYISNNNQHNQHPISVQFINETEKLFARAQAGSSYNDTDSTVNIEQPRQINNNNNNNTQLQFKSQSETLQQPSYCQSMDVSGSSCSFSYSHLHNNNTYKRSAGPSVGLFALPSESTLLSNTSLLRNGSLDSLSSDNSFVFNPSMRLPSSNPINNNNNSNNNNSSFPNRNDYNIAPCASNSCLRENIEDKNELRLTTQPMEVYTSDFVTPGGYIEELPVDPQTLHLDMDNIDPVARDKILRGFEEKKKRDGYKKEDNDK